MGNWNCCAAMEGRRSSRTVVGSGEGGGGGGGGPRPNPYEVSAENMAGAPKLSVLGNLPISHYYSPLTPSPSPSPSPSPAAEAGQWWKKQVQQKQPPFPSLSPTAEQLLHLPVGGDILERYRLGDELGRGEFGITYLCTDLASGERFACKSISKRRLRTAVDIEDVRREAVIMHLLPRHPNIVALHGLYEDDNAVHLVMELCEGGELFDRIVARGHYGERAAAAITHTIVQVVQVRSYTPCDLNLSLLFAYVHVQPIDDWIDAPCLITPPI
jgi:hypothetical protein